RRFAGLPDPEIPRAQVPRHLQPLWQFAWVADDLEQFVRRCRGGNSRAPTERDIELRVDVFKELCAKGELAGRLPYAPEVREPGYVPDYQRGSEQQFI